MTVAETRLHRYFLILKVFLALTPVLCYLYVSMLGVMNNMSFQQVLQQTPSITVVFLITMVNPYVAFLVQLVERKLAIGDRQFACCNMLLLLLAQLLTLNLIYFTMLAFVCYQAIRCYKIQLFPTIKGMGVKLLFFHGGGSMLVMMISCVCLFATIRLL